MTSFPQEIGLDLRKLLFRKSSETGTILLSLKTFTFLVLKTFLCKQVFVLTDSALIIEI